MLQKKGRNRKEDAALYLRLSAEDGDKAESNSIGGQRALLTEFVAKTPGMEIAGEYVDDGYTGTNFDRPGFTRMMEDAKRGKISCILVKDLSRLGRNYIETGRYVDRIFPFMDIRFIAVNDNYDSADEEDTADNVIVPFKNLINDAYCKDISQKVRSQLDVKRRTGQFIGSFAAFGYKKDEKDHNHLVVDEYAAEVIRDIYRCRMRGMSCQRIADKLNAEEIPSPFEYKRMQGLNFNSGYKSSGKAKWGAVQVKRILTNESYLGTMVQGKNRKINYKVKRSEAVDEEDWIRVEGTHDAIIDREVFDMVQVLLDMDTRCSPDSETVRPLAGLVVCGDCGENMVRRMTKKKNKTYYYLHCSTYITRRGCTSHLVNEEKLYTAVFEQLKRHVAAVIALDDMVKKLGRIPDRQYRARATDQQIAVLDAEIDRYVKLRRQIYEDMAAGVVTPEDYEEFSKSFTEKAEAARRSKERLLERRAQILTEGRIAWADVFRRYRDMEELTRQAAVSLIDKVIVYSKDRIEVRFRFQEEMEETLQAVSGFAKEEARCAM
ncbi:MAG: recombinase family protein [Lachnospiraceae bacterium]|nr:recombinase family protein [Lachnospiraceae bacterium]